MEIAFKCKNGLCPNFSYNGIKYYIQDVKDNEGKYRYQLCEKIIKKDVHKFETNKELSKFLESQNARLLERYGSFDTYHNRYYYFKVENNTVTKMHKEEWIGYTHDTYAECLEASKNYLEKLIAEENKRKIPHQISFFDL